MKKPLFSIIIPCYDDGKYLREVMESVERCDENLYQAIIVNDGSTDAETLKILSELEAKNYTVIHQANKGLGAARNAGINRATGAYILPLDSDNRIHPAYLSLSLKIFERDAKVGVVYGNAQFFGEKEGVWQVPEFEIERFLVGNFIDACAVFRREVWEQVGGFDEKMPQQGWEDWDFWVSATEKGWTFEHLNKIVFDYRVRSDSMISEFRDKVEPLEIKKYMLAKHSDFFLLLAKKLFERKELLEAKIEWFERKPFRSFARTVKKKFL